MSRTVSLFPRGYPFESLAKANSRRKVISVYDARLISYHSHIFIATAHTRTYLCMDACARNDTRLWPRDRIRSEGWKNTVAAVFYERVESGGDEANVGSATVCAHTVYHKLRHGGNRYFLSLSRFIILVMWKLRWILHTAERECVRYLINIWFKII